MNHFEKRGFKHSETKELFRSFLKDERVYETLNITYKDVISRLFTWLRQQPNEIHNETMERLEEEVLYSKDKCFEERLYRIVSILDFSLNRYNPIKVSIIPA